MNLFTIENLRVQLGGRTVLDIPSLQVPEGRIVALTGPNGSGKTTLLQVLAGLLEPAKGSVRYRDGDLLSRESAFKETTRKGLGIVLQSPYLFKTTVLGNVCYGLIKRGMSRPQAAERAKKALDLVGLGGLAKRPHTALSGGEAQRVALARALVLQPEVLLLDEPFANVDAASRSVIERVLLQENSYGKTSVIFTTHDLEQAYRMADTVVTLFEGRVHEGSMENLFHGRVKVQDPGPVFDTGRIEIAIPADRIHVLTAAVPPESILVSLEPVATSARNSLRGRITAVRERNGTVDVVVDVGEMLMARITKGSYEEMGLRLGQGVYLIFKAEAVRLY